MSATPELIILFSAVACVGSAVVLYFNRSNAAAAGIVVIGFIACLYGIGQRSAQEQGSSDAGWWKPYNADVDARDKVKKVDDPPPVRRQTDVIPDEPPKRRPPPPPAQLPSQQASQLPLSPPNQLNSLGPASPTVIISSFTSRITANKYVEVSGRLVNMNEFPIKNVVVKCGDTTFASGDVSATVDKIIPARSDYYVSGVRMGPIKPNLPPTTCLIANFDRAD